MILEAKRVQSSVDPAPAQSASGETVAAVGRG